MANRPNVMTVEQQFLTRLNNLGPEGNRLATAAVNVVADLIVAEAKRLAPKDLGTIAQNIGKTVTGEGDKVRASIYAAAPESAFQEFGTGGKVQVPVAMQDIAIQFKGKSSGDFKAFVLALTAWVKRNGIVGVYSVQTRKRSNAAKFGGKQGNDDADEKAAYAIARKILRDGLKPQPFMYPAYISNNWKLLPMLQNAYRELTARVNR